MYFACMHTNAICRKRFFHPIPIAIPNRSLTEMHFTEVNECEGPIESHGRARGAVEKWWRSRAKKSTESSRWDGAFPFFPTCRARDSAELPPAVQKVSRVRHQTSHPSLVRRKCVGNWVRTSSRILDLNLSHPLLLSLRPLLSFYERFNFSLSPPPGDVFLTFTGESYFFGDQ